MGLSDASNATGVREVQDVALLVSVFWREHEAEWQNVAHALEVLRPTFSSLAVDMWDVPAGDAR
eukprot:6939643-Prymnesium_polylepis.1